MLSPARFTRCSSMFAMPQPRFSSTLRWLILLGRARNRPAASARKNPKKPLSCQWWSTEIHGAKMRSRWLCGKRGIWVRTVWVLAVLCLFSGVLRAQTTIRVGAFPNITHAQPMIGKASGWFEKGMGSNVKIQWTSFNAGPSAIEALFAGAIDMTYVGPNPAITGYVRSQGEALRVVAGTASGGASLIVRSDSGIHKPEDFHGKKLLNQQIQKETSKALAPAILDEAFGRLQVTYDPVRNSLLTSARSAYDAGFLGRQMPDLSNMYDLSLLNQVLAEKGKKAIQ